MYRLLRPVLIGVLPIALAACSYQEPAAATPVSTPLGADLGGSGPVRPAAGEGHALYRQQMVHAGHTDAHGTGTLNSVDPAQHKVNISHGPISEIGWPAMTMEFAVAPSVDLRALKPGARINFTIEQGAGGMYEIQAISPAGAAK